MPPTSRALSPDGKRLKLYPLEVPGRFTTLQNVMRPLLIAFYAVLPWLDVGGHPAVWLDVTRRRFFLFGLTFNAQDFHLVFFLLSGTGFLLVVMSALAGRLWCGWACPQTVFLEGVYRKIERLTEGPARQRQTRDHGPWNAERGLRWAAKHALFLLATLSITHILLAYFVSLPDLFRMVQAGPGKNLDVFVGIMAVSAVLHFNFVWFREQLCVVICPYGRLQSVLADRETITVVYDVARGEPRGKKGVAGNGDCVACNKCVQVCPTGIDIRNGLQLECIGCAHCVDACDGVMASIGKPAGLIRHDSLAGVAGQPHRFWRPRVAAYLVAGLVGLGVASYAATARENVGVAILHSQGAPHTRVGDKVMHQLMVHVTNKSGLARKLDIKAQAPGASNVVLPVAHVDLEPFAGVNLPMVVEVPFGSSDRITVEVDVSEGETALSTRKMTL